MPPRDPYVLDPALVAEPPPTWVGRLRELGPGLVLTASIVGSGELIATTRLGAEAGFVALWVILLSCVVKVALQLQFGRHVIQTGETALAAFNRMPGPKLRGVHWTIWFWLLIQPLKVLQVGGIVGGVALLMHELAPRAFGGGLAIGSMVVSPVAIWCALAATTTAALISSERYRMIERLCVVMVAAFTATTIISVVSLQWTDYGISGADLLSGLRFQLPSEQAVLLSVVGAFGLTGVGGDEVMHYTYWLIEKGYAAKTGRRSPNDPAWTRRARQWIHTMYFDALVSMAVYTLVTAAFYLLGAAVLHAQGTTPNNNQLVGVLATMYTESLGPWAWGVFMAGAFFVLFSTLFSALAAWTRTFADAAGLLGVIDFANLRSRRRAIVVFAWFFPLAWAAVYLCVENPSWMVLIGGVGTAAMLIIVMVGAVDFRYRRAALELTPGRLFDAALWLSIAAITVFLAYSAVSGVRHMLE
jgi:Mn2+/Fe2+ NRAMP family transporter